MFDLKLLICGCQEENMRFKLFGILLFVYISSCIGYYWRDYHGRIPLDAFIAGKDINNENIYIGLGFFKSTDPGIYPAIIQYGKDVFIPLYGVTKADNFVQILCGSDLENFHWILTNATHLHLLNTENHLIRGGLEADKWLNIGRVNYQGGLCIGKVLSGNIGNSDLWFIHNEEELSSKSYEILSYNDVSSKKKRIKNSSN